MLTSSEPQRPPMPHAPVLLTTIASRRPLSPKAVTAMTARALLRAHVDSPTHGAHVLRHAAATPMLRHGASLPSIGAVLRHASVETTAHYAKVDVTLFHEVARPWPAVLPCSCLPWTRISLCTVPLALSSFPSKAISGPSPAWRPRVPPPMGWRARRSPGRRWPPRKPDGSIGCRRADPTDRLAALEVVMPPTLCRGHFSVPDKRITLLRAE